VSLRTPVASAVTHPMRSILLSITTLKSYGYCITVRFLSFERTPYVPSDELDGAYWPSTAIDKALKKQVKDLHLLALKLEERDNLSLASTQAASQSPCAAPRWCLHLSR
jgi:hypothetical protein